MGGKGYNLSDADILMIYKASWEGKQVYSAIGKPYGISAYSVKAIKMGRSHAKLTKTINLQGTF